MKKKSISNKLRFSYHFLEKKREEEIELYNALLPDDLSRQAIHPTALYSHCKLAQGERSELNAPPGLHHPTKIDGNNNNNNKKRTTTRR